jgi:dTDP-4-dehydrorhamnose 3,5-epimerase
MKVIATELPGMLLLEPQVFGDARGFFMETWQAARYRGAGMPERFVQDNHSRSRRGVLRGLHYQLDATTGQAGVGDAWGGVRCGGGHSSRLADLSVAGTVACWMISNHRQLYIPPGFAHGFCVLSEEADFFYKCTDYYHPSSERGIAWDDPEIGIAWPLRDGIALSAKDQRKRAVGRAASRRAAGLRGLSRAHRDRRFAKGRWAGS